MKSSTKYYHDATGKINVLLLLYKTVLDIKRNVKGTELGDPPIFSRTSELSEYYTKGLQWLCLKVSSTEIVDKLAANSEKRPNRISPNEYS